MNEQQLIAQSVQHLGYIIIPGAVALIALFSFARQCRNARGFHFIERVNKAVKENAGAERRAVEELDKRRKQTADARMARDFGGIFKK